MVLLCDASKELRVVRHRPHKFVQILQNNITSNNNNITIKKKKICNFQALTASLNIRRSIGNLQNYIANYKENSWNEGDPQSWLECSLVASGKQIMQFIQKITKEIHAVRQILKIGYNWAYQPKNNNKNKENIHKHDKTSLSTLS